MRQRRILHDEDVLRGRGLRFVLVEEIRQRGTMTVAEMVSVVAEHGYTIAGRASKVISDALRWEIARGRIIRVERGVYTYGYTPPATARRIRLFARRCHAWILAATTGETPPPTPQTPPPRRGPNWLTGEDPARPPWESLYWLWTT